MRLEKFAAAAYGRARPHRVVCYKGPQTIALGDVFLAAGTEFVLAYIAGNGFSVDSFTATKAAPVPEPATMTVLTMGLVGLGMMRRRRSALRQ